MTTSLIHAGTYGDMNNGTATPFYSNAVPGRTIVDPLAVQKLVNNWSLGTSAAIDREHRFTPSAAIPNAGFSFETFVRFQDISTAAGDDFAYQRTNGDGGWLLELNSNGTVHAALNSRTGPIGTSSANVTINSGRTR